MLVFEQGLLSRKNLSRAIFASVNYLSSALVMENLSYFPFTLPKKTCQRKLASVNGLFHVTGCSQSPSPPHKKTECLMSNSDWRSYPRQQIFTRGSLTLTLNVFNLSLFNNFNKRLRFAFTANVEYEITFSQRLDLFQTIEKLVFPMTVTVTIVVNCQSD